MSSVEPSPHTGRYMGSATERLAHEKESTAPLIDVGVETDRLKDLARRILALPDGATLDPEMIQDGITSLAKLYTAKAEASQAFPPFAPSRSMPVTVAMTTTSAMISQVNIELFELGMWRLWSEK